MSTQEKYLIAWRNEVLHGETLLGFKQWLASQVGVYEASLLLKTV